MSLSEVLKLLSENNIRVGLENGQLKVHAAKGAMTPDIMAVLKEHKEELLSWAHEVDEKQKAQKPIPKRDTFEPAPLSFAQQRLWFIDQLAPGSVTYNVPAAVVLRGNLDVAILQQVINQLVERHESLRTCFIEQKSGEARQVVVDDIDVSLEVEHTDLALDDENELLALAKRELLTPFDLSAAPLFRLRLLQLRDDNNKPCHLLLLNLHHIITDGWSNGILMQEIAYCYSELAEGRTPELPPLPVQYADYAAWQQEQLPPEKLAEKTRYWREQLADVPVLELATDYPRPARKSGRGNTVHFNIESSVSEAVQRIARKHDCTPFVVLLAAWQTLLHRYTGQSDICVGSPTANRNRAETQGIIGFFVNTLALRTDFSGNPDFATVLKRSQQVMLEANEHQDVPFESIVDALGISREMSTTPVFQAAISYQKDEGEQKHHLAGIDIEPLDIDTGTAKFDITLGISENANGYQCLIEYDSDLYCAERIERMSRHLNVLLNAICTDAGQAVATLPLLTEHEHRLLTEEWRGETRHFDKHIHIAAQIEKHAQQTPDKLAVDFPGWQLSYREFNEQASRMAHFLAENGFGKGDYLAVCIQRSPAMLVSIFAALKAGGCYIPIDPQYPADRIGYMLDDSKPRFVITLDANRETIAANSEQTVFGFESLATKLADFNANWQTPPDNNNGEDLAYIMYTSGSTGRPKGVMMPQRGVCRLALNSNFVHVSRDDNVAHMCNIAFDATAFEIWTALLNGCTLVGIEPDTVLDSAAFAERLADKQVTVMVMTTALFNIYVSDNPDMFSGVRYLFVGGEALDPNKVRELLRAKKPAHLMNGYGPTENACFTACYDIQTLDEDAATVPLGYPVNNSNCYIVDNNMQLLPVGVPGELCASGDGIASGYLNKPEQTATAFVENPFREDPGRVLYRTGDVCRWRENGTIEMLGRVDDQVKIRGFRIEPGEISNQLGLLDEVADCAVIVRENSQGNKYLAAYLVAGNPAEDSQELIGRVREQLADRLPHYMVPQAWSLLESLPMTANGKLDKKALPEPELNLSGDQPYVAPRNREEQAIAAIWQEVLEQNEISVFANFFEAGGHSLLATRVVARLREALDVPMAIGDLFENPTIAELALHSQMLENRSHAAPPLTAMKRPDAIPLSFAQQRLWFIDQLEPGSAVYHMPFALRIRGELNVDALQQAYDALLQRHETLRTRIVSANGVACQHIDDDTDNHLGFYSVDDDDREILSRASEFLLTPFDLAKGPLIRAELLQQSGHQDYVLLLCLHHIIADGWSMDILLRDLLALYQHYAWQLPLILPALDVQYADYTLWQQQWLKGNILEEQISYWREQLKNNEITQLPADFPRPPVLDNRGAQYSFTLPASLSETLRHVAGEQQVTLFMLGLAAFNVLLARYSNQSDISIGTPVANRPQSALHELIGLFINTLVIRNELDESQSFSELLEDIKALSMQAFRHQDVPFELLVDELHVPRDLGQTPLFNVMFILQAASEAGRLSVPQGSGLDVEALSDDGDHTTAKFDLTLNLIDDDTLRGVIEYRTSLFSDNTIARLATHFISLLEALCREPEKPLADITFISQDEIDRQLDFESGLNATAVDYPSCQALHHLVEAQVDKTPDATAIVFHDERLSYAELNRRANQLAHTLMACGAGNSQPVAVCLERSPAMSIALLAVLKAGGAYVPFDPDFPAERLAFMAEDTGCRILLTTDNIDVSKTIDVEHCIQLDTPHSWQQQSDQNPDTVIADDALFNIIYTSGSTGTPKGVMVPHRGIINRLNWMQHQYPIDAGDRILQKTPYSFDVSVWELFWPLICGSTIVFARPQGHKEPAYLRDLIIDESITTLHFVPSMLGVFLQTDGIDACQSVRQVFCSGEALQLEHSKQFYQQLPKATLHNLYGPTEASVDVSFYDCVADEPHRTVPIGKPVHNTQLHILDKNLNLLPFGVAGDLYIGGVQLAQGYLNRDELTHDTFIDNPFYHQGHPSKKLYKTGDVARYLADGNIEYLGRSDHQIKIRGLRIELGEIESRLQKMADVREAIVMAHSPDGQNDNLQLVAWLLADNEPDVQSIKQALAKKLPDYMVPVHFVYITEWPLSPNGKIDRKALPLPDLSRRQTEYMAPTSDLEKTLVNLWQQRLPASQIGIHDNFFELGGHSLLATRVLADISSEFGIELAVRTLFEAPTVAMLADIISNSDLHEKPLPPIEVIERDQALPLSFNQERLWFVYKMAPEAASYNMPMALDLHGEIDTGALNQAINYMIARHEILRTVFSDQGDQAVQTILPPFEWQPDKDSITGDLQSWINHEAMQPFDLEKGPLFRLKLWHIEENHHVLMLTMHHIISDALSLENTVRELAIAYQAFCQNQPVPLPKPAIQYADFAWWQQHVLSGDYLDQLLDYWRRQLDGAPELLQLPTDKPRPAQQTNHGAVFSATMGKTLVNHARDFARQNRLTPFMLLLACQQILLGRYAGQDDVCIGVPVAGRHQKGTQDMLGFFVNALVLRSRFDDNPSVEGFLQRVRETVLSAFAHQDAPFDKVIEQSSKSRSSAFSPIVQIGFNYISQARDVQELSLDNLAISTIDPDHVDAKYDMIWAFQDNGDDIHVTIEYRTDLYLPQTISRFYRHFEQLLGNMLGGAERPVKRIEVVDPEHLFGELNLSKGAIERILPLTPMQRDLYLDTMIDPYNRRNYFGWIHRVDELIDIDRFQQAIDVITSQFSALRMRIVGGNRDYLDIAYSAIVRADSPKAKIPVQYLDWSQDKLSEEAFNRRCNEELAFVPYDMANEPVIRFIVIKETANTSAIVLTAHHTCIDGISLQTVTDGYSRAYEALCKGEELPELPDDIYPDYISAQFDNCDNQQSHSFWQEKAQQVEAIQCHAPDLPRHEKGRYHFIEYSDSAEHFAAIKQFCEQNGTTPFLYFKALYALMLQSWCQADNGFYYADIIAARPKGHINQTGCYFEWRPTVIPEGILTADASIADVLHYLDDYRKQVRGGKNISNSLQQRLFPQSDTQFLFNFYLTDRYLPFMDKRSRTTFIVPEMENAVTFTAIVDDNHLLFNFTYTDNIFVNNRFIERMLHLSQQILDGKTQLAELSLQLPDETASLAEPVAHYPADNIITLIERQAEQTPDAIAVDDGSKKYTYRELNARANQLAHYLLVNGAESGRRIAICHSAESELMVAILAVLKSGAAYVPIDAEYPVERIRHIASDADAAFLLIEQCLYDRVAGLHSHVIAIDAMQESLSNMGDNNPGTDVSLDDPLYTIYTSGSTGLPKGASVSQRGELNLIDWYNREFAITADDNMLVISAIGFDLTQKNLLAPLCAGATVSFTGERYDPALIVRCIEDQHITLLNCAPSAFYPLVERANDYPALASLRYVLFGGEPIRMTAMIDWLEHDLCGAKLVNMYGPTECTDIAAFYVIDNPRDFINTPVPIGKANDNVNLHVVDSSLRLLPKGLPGELLISGESLGLGYLNQPELTAQSFVEHPVLGRVYRTGDRVVEQSDGNLRFIGRLDHQLKVRGLRMEAGEIEQTLRRIENVNDALVLVKDDRLTGFVLTDDGEPPDNWRNTLADYLPDYMIPQALVALREWPLTANGKIDRKALPAAGSSAERKMVAPRTETEEKLLAIWRDVLGLDAISIDDNFFELGGHSLLAARAVSRIREQFDRELPLRDVFTSPTIATIADLLGRNTQASSLPPLLPVERAPATGKLFPLSFAQLRLWFIDRLQPGSATYNMPFALRIKGDLNITALQQAFNTLQQRHEVLRTRIIMQDDIAWQLADEQPQVNLELKQHEEEKTALAVYTADFLARPFNLLKDHLLRAEILQLGHNDYALLLCLHHIIADGGTLDILLRDMLALYQAGLSEEPAALPPLDVQYIDYSVWQRGWLEGDILAQQITYWRTQLQGIEALDIPTDYARPPQLDDRGSQYHFTLEKSLSESVRALCRKHDLTLFMLLFGAFRLLLGKYSGQNDITIGTPVANRPLPALENMAGLFVNTLVIRTSTDDNDSIIDFLQHVKATSVDALAHQDVPFELLVEELNVPRDLSQTPLFQAMFVMQESAAADLSDNFGNLQLQALDSGAQHTTAKFDITLNMITSEEIGAVIEYRKALFSEASITRMADHLKRLLEAVCETPEQPVSSLSFISRNEINQQLDFANGLNATAFDYPPCQALHHLIESQVAKTPDATAIVFHGEHLSYGELNRRANQLAHHLIECGAGNNQPVAVCLERSPAMSIALLAVLKAGCAYVPFDPDFPAERLAFMAEDTGCHILLTTDNIEVSKTLDVAHCIQLDTPQSWQQQPDHNPAVAIDDDALFNIIYTSGSTGTPKGVMVPHRGIINRLNWMQHQYPIDNNDRILQKTPYSFDVSVWELFWPLMCGSTLVFAKPQGHKEPAYLRDLMIDEGITTLHFVPSMLGVFLQTEGIDACRSVRQVFCSGEALQLEHSKQFYQQLPNATLHNLYGPTEASVDVSFYDCVADEPHRTVPIGKPVHNTQLHILDKNLNLLPFGVAGDLYIGGVQLAQGYLNRDELTRDTFIDNPFYAQGHPSEKLYKTGDVARYLADGNIEYLGRSDHQIKIRGLRIELGEIESRLQKMADVREAIVMAKSPDGHNENLQLVAWLLADSEPDVKAIKQSLAKQLPDYMVPVHFVYITEWPLSPNGKIDRKALPEPESIANSREFIAPQTPLQQQLLDIWQQHLPAAHIGITDNFFELGGHSLLAIRILSAISRQINIELPVRVLFESPTIELLAELIEHNDSTIALPAIEPVSRDQQLPLSYNQQRLWFLAQLDANSPAYNMPAALKISGTLDTRALEKAFASLIERQEALRCNFIAEAGEPRLLIHKQDIFQLQIADISNDAELNQLMKHDAEKPFDLAQDSLLRATLVNTGPDQHILLLNMHHIISDGLSVQILIRELAAFYLRHAESLPLTLPELPLQYADYAHWQRSWLQGEVLEQQLDFWRHTLKGVPTLLPLPLDRPRPPVQRFVGAQLDVGLNQKLVKQLRETALENSCTLFMTLLAAYQVLLQKYSKQNDICIGIPLAGRSVPEVENLIGFFINALVIRGDLSANLSLAELLQQVRSRSLAAFAHEHVPIEMLLNELGIERNLAYTPVVQCALNMMAGDNTLPQNMDDLPGDMQLELMQSEGVVAKFDLQFNLMDNGEHLDFSIDYNTDIFDRSTIETMAGHFIDILQLFADNTDTHLHQVLPGELPTPDSYEKALPLTLMQRDIYLASLAKPETIENSLGFAMEIPFPVDVDVWRQVLVDMTAACSILRADVISNDIPWQDIAYLGIHKTPDIDFELLDWSDENLSDTELRQRLDKLIWRPFDVNQSVRTVYRLIRLADNRHWMTMTAHHMILDGYAVSIQGVLHIAFYEQRLKDPDYKIELPDNFVDYIDENRHDFDNYSTLQYWREQLAKTDSLEAFDGRGHESRLLSLNVAPEHFQQVKKFCRAQKITPALYFKTLYAWLICQYTRAESAINIIEFHGGRSKENRETLGCFYHTYPSVITVDGLESGTTGAFRTLREQQKNSKNHLQISPLQMSRLTPPSRLHFSYNFLMMPHHTHIFGEKVSAIRYTPNAEGMVDMRIQADGDDLSFWLAYNSALFDDHSFLERLLRLSEQMVNLRPQSLDQLSLLLPGESAQNWLPAVTAPLVHTAISEQVSHTPDSVAVICGDTTLDYRKLDQHSNALAHALIERGVSVGDRVGVCLGRRVELLVSLLAVIKAGGCYIPMDVSYPAERLTYMLEDSDAALVITEDCMADKLAVAAERLLSVDGFQYAAFEHDAPDVAVGPDDLLYMIYTSGSTGLPKAASVYHRSEANLLGWYSREYNFSSADRTLVISATGFDLTQKNLFALLTCGGTVVLPDTDHYDVERYLSIIEQEQITVLNCAPSAFYPLLELGGEKAKGILNHLRVLLFGGEPIQLRHLRPWIESDDFNTTLVNMYGPTECTDIAASYTLTPNQLRLWPDDRPIPLGGASAGVTLHVLNEQLQPMPPGLVGELYISGAGVGAGYWQRPELTSASFITNPFAKGESDRILYKTGDRVRWIQDPAGLPVLEYLGRKDFQVKLRGLRIELGEVEQALDKLDAVIDNHVLVEDEQLLGFVQLQPDATLADDWREQLALPDYMIPAQLITVSEWPLTPNGKVDRKALLHMERPAATARYVAPRTETERELAELWQEVLGNPVGVHDNFFAAGGDSLAAVRLVARIELRFDSKIPVASLFNAQTIAQLAHVIQQQTGHWSPVVPIQPQGDKTPIFAIHALGAMVLSYQPLAEALGEDQPFYGIQAYGFEDDQQPFTDLAEMVGYYTAAIKEQQPEGPYKLLGHSFGGLIAVEVARQLQAIGETVESLTLLDTHMPNRYMGRFVDDAMILKTFAEHNFGVVDVPLNALRKLPKDKMVETVAEQFHGTVSAEFIHRAIAIIRGFKEMMKGYKPGPIDVPVTLIRPEKAIAGNRHKAIKLVLGQNAHTLGWHKVAKQLTLEKAPGDHFSMLQAPNCEALARQIPPRSPL